jgi:hypothetical protein
MYKYLIIECEELDDQWECDATRTPLLMTNDISKWEHRMGYEIYEVCSNGALKLVKGYEDVGNCWGFAVYCWDDANADATSTPNTVYQTFPQMDRHDFLKTVSLKQIKNTYGFQDNYKIIKREIFSSGSHGEEIDGKWVVMGEYFGDCYSSGY